MFNRIITKQEIASERGCEVFERGHVFCTRESVEKFDLKQKINDEAEVKQTEVEKFVLTEVVNANKALKRVRTINYR